MKTSRIMSALACLFLAGAFAASGAQAAEYTFTTKTADGGFDYWGDIRTGGNLTPAGEYLSVGNTLGHSNPKAVTILMFDLSSFALPEDEVIQSVQLSYYVTNAWGSTAGTVSYAPKTSAGMNWNTDIGNTLLPASWTSVGTATTPINAAGQTATLVISDPAAVTAVLGSSVAYAAFRIVSAPVYGIQDGAAAYGFRIASSENTSGYLVPTLTIITQVIPEPAQVGLLLGAGMLIVWVALRRRVRR